MAYDVAADTELHAVNAWIVSSVGGPGHVGPAFRDLIRQGFDEVIDGPRTRRCRIDELEKTEKTYLGTKIEILVRSLFGGCRGEVLDLSICDQEVDVKFSVSDAWMIPPEATGHLCLLIYGRESTQRFGVGLLRMIPEHRGAENRDRKTSVSALGKQRIHWIAEGDFPLNYLATLSEDDRQSVFAGASATDRVAQLARVSVGRIIPRLAFETVTAGPLGRHKDPMKRLRRNGGSRERLLAEGIAVLFGEWQETRDICAKMGVQAPMPGQAIVLRPSTEIIQELLAAE